MARWRSLAWHATSVIRVAPTTLPDTVCASRARRFSQDHLLVDLAMLEKLAFDMGFASTPCLRPSTATATAFWDSRETFSRVVLRSGVRSRESGPHLRARPRAPCLRPALAVQVISSREKTRQSLGRAARSGRPRGYCLPNVRGARCGSSNGDPRTSKQVRELCSAPLPEPVRERCAVASSEK
jgi:hypothetical protein